MNIPFASQSYQHASLPLSAQRVVNMYAESQPKGAKSTSPILGCPGIVTEATLGDGPVRGFHVMDGTLYAVSGAFLYQVNADGTTVTLGGQISGINVVSMDDNGTELVIVNGVNGYVWSALAGFRIISDTSFNAADTVTFMDGFFLFNNSGTGQFFRSDLLDGTSYDGTAFTTAESQSDDLLAIRNHKQVLYALGRRTIELYGNVGAANFPFQRIPGTTVDRGVAGSFATTDEDESLFILGNDRIGYRLNGRSLQRISTHAIESRAWQNYSTVENVITFAYTWNGHKFIFYTFPNIAATWCFDVATNLWHERESHDRLGNSLGRWRGNCVENAYSRVYVGDAFSGKIGYLSNTTYTEFGDNTRALAVSPPLHADGKRVFMPWFELDIETGVGLSSGQGSNPQVMLSVSDNGGRSFESPEVWSTFGKQGEYKDPALFVRWDRLGQFFNRHVKIEISDPVRRAIYGARAPEMSAGV